MPEPEAIFGGAPGPSRGAVVPTASHHAAQVSYQVIDLVAVLGTLRRRWALIGATTVVLTAVAALGMLAITPRYQATATLMIRPSEGRVVDLKEVAPSGPDWSAGYDSVIATEIGILRSRTLADEVIAALGLVQGTELKPWQPLGDLSLPSTLADWSRRAAALLRLLPASANREPGAVPPALTDTFLERLAVSQEGQAHIVAVSFTSRNPTMAALVANTVAARYLDDQLRTKFLTAEQADSWITTRLDKLRTQVQQAERRVSDYRAANGLADLINGGLDAQQLASVQAELAAARADRLAREARLAGARALNERGGRRSLIEVASSPTISALRQRQAALQGEEARLLETYGERHPDIIRIKAEIGSVTAQIESEISAIADGIANEVAVARLREESLERTLQEAKKSHADASRAGVQLRELEREANAARELYEKLLARSKEIGEQRDLLAPDARILSLAVVPDESSFPKPKLVLPIAFMGALGLGVTLTALLEHLDRRLRGVREVEAALGVPVLGLVPRTPRLRAGQSPHSYLLEKPLSAYTEAVKAVQLTSQLNGPAVRPRVLLVTSALPNEGKTTLAIGLALSAAEAGQRAIVVDLDLRRPSVAWQLGETATGGVVEVASGEQVLADAVGLSRLSSRLHFLGVKRRVATPSELLTSDVLGVLVSDLRRRYDFVVLDSPPALGLVDARIASQLADAVLYVVRWGHTSAEAAALGLEGLRTSRIPVQGVVLAQVDLHRHRRYGLGDAGKYYDQYRKYFVN